MAEVKDKLPLPAGLLDGPEAAFERTRMSIGDHLEELRRRVWWSVVVIGIAFIPWYAAGDWLLHVLTQPLVSQLSDEVRREFRIIFTSPQEGFLTYLKVTFLAAFVSTAPITFWFLWGFIAAGLYPHEKKWINLFAPLSFVMFIGGVAFLYFVVMPWVMSFLIGFWNPPPMPLNDGSLVPMVQPTVALSSYVSFLMWMSILMGLVFQTPLIQAFLALVGMVNPDTFARYRRHVIAGSVVAAAILTPPDVVSQLMTAGPFLLLYEIGIWIGRMFWRTRGHTATPPPATP